MSITNRLEDAGILYERGRHEGALLSVLIAVAGSSHRRFPLGTPSLRNPLKQMGDEEAFQTFMVEELHGIGTCSVYFNGQCNSAEKVFYKFLRCNLAHEAKLPSEITFCPGHSDREAVFHRESGPPERLIVTYPVVLLLAHIVCTAKENADIPDSVRMSLLPR